MATAIHTQLKQLAGPNPAAYLATDFIRKLTIDRLLASADKIKGIEIPVGQKVLSAALDNYVVFLDPTKVPILVKYPDATSDQIGLSLNSNLSVNVKIFIKGDKTKIISTVTVVVDYLMLLGSYSNNVIAFEGVDFHPTPTITRDPAASTNLAAAGIDPIEAARVEGLIAYSSINTAISETLGQRKEISLSKLFPAFDFGTAASLFPIQEGSFLGIVPKELTVVQQAACQCASGPDLGTSASTNTITVPANPTVGTNLGSVTIGGPLPENIDPLRDLGRRFKGDGQAGVYLPRAAYSALTVKPMPAIELHASDNGFIGFDATATVAFSNFQVSLDATNGGIIVSIGMDISVEASCTLDMGCGIRAPIGYAIINQSPGSSANLTMGFYPVVDASGNLQLRSVLNSVNMGTYVAVILGIETALEIIGVTAWIGFLIDVVLSAIVSYELPSALTNELKKYLGSNEWALLSMGNLLQLMQFQGGVLAAPFDVDGDTMLASIDAVKK
jgi:hypothetical protein